MALPLPYWKEKGYKKPQSPILPAGHAINTQNIWERAACEKLWKDGYEVYRRGWPDFVAVKGNEIIFIEVKPPKNKKMKRLWLDPDQKRMAAILRRFYGIHVKVWNRYKDFDKKEIKSDPLAIPVQRRKKYKSGYGEHLVKPLVLQNSLTETVPTQG